MTCKRCGECCKFGLLKDGNLQHIANSLHLSLEDFSKYFSYRPTQKNDYCIHYDIDNKLCKIYDNRPQVCRDFFCEDAR